MVHKYQNLGTVFECAIVHLLIYIYIHRFSAFTCATHEAYVEVTTPSRIWILHGAKEMISITVSATERPESPCAVQCTLLVNLRHSSRWPVDWCCWVFLSCLETVRLSKVPVMWNSQFCSTGFDRSVHCWIILKQKIKHIATVISCFCLQSVQHFMRVCAVSYTHLTLPTNHRV